MLLMRTDHCRHRLDTRPAVADHVKPRTDTPEGRAAAVPLTADASHSALPVPQGALSSSLTTRLQ